MVLVLINGSLFYEFKLNKRLRQGNPLIPFVFIIVIEGLSGLMREATLRRFFF